MTDCSTSRQRCASQLGSRSLGLWLLILLRPRAMLPVPVAHRSSAGPATRPSQDRMYDGAFALDLKRDTFSLMPRPATNQIRVGARPYQTSEKIADVAPPTSRSVGGRTLPAASAPSASPVRHGAAASLPPLQAGSPRSPRHGSPPLGRPKPRPNALNVLAKTPQLPSSPSSVLSPPPAMRLF